MIRIHTSTFSFPMVSGLHCPKGIVYPLVMSGDAGSTSASVQLRDLPESQTSVQLIPSIEVVVADGNCALVGGGGSWEGEGFLALVDATTREAHWLLYVQNSEEFVGAFERGGEFYGISECYPDTFEWRIRGGGLPFAEYKRAIAA